MSDAEVTFLILPFVFLSVLIGSTLVRGRRTPLDIRPIQGYQILSALIDEGVESNRLPHFSLGTAIIGQESTVAALAAANALYPLFKRLSFQKRLPLVTLSDPITLAIAADTLRKAYLYRNNAVAFRPDAVAWYPIGERSVTFAAGAAAHSTDLDVANHILLGQFGAELAYFAEAGRRRDQKILAHSTRLEGQAIAFVMADYHIIGEELFVSDAYANPHDPLAMGSLIALDFLRWASIVIIVLAVILNIVR